MQSIKRFLYCRPVALVVGLMAFFNPFLFYLSTDFHGCFADVVPGTDVLIRVLQMLVAVGILGLLFVRNLGIWHSFSEHKAVVIAYFVLAVLAALLFVANVVILILLSSGIPMARYYFEIEAPYLLGFGVAISLAFVIPRLASRTKIAIVVLVYFLCGILLVAVDFWHIEPFAFTVEPIVFDVGDGYSVVWSTTHVSTGYLTYTYAGTEYEVDDANYGRLASNHTIHRVHVPYDHLDGNTYTVHSTYMIDNAPYFPARGRTLTASRTFRGRPEGDIKMVAITDNHCLSRTKFNRVRQDDYDVVVMLGDFSDFVHQELDIADFLLYPAWHLSNGEVPVLYAKGNHDTHSEMGADLGYLLGFDSFYYRTTYGDYTFTVLDSGSCNVDLEEAKYGGVGRYIDYREGQLDWLSAFGPSSGYDVAIVHVWDYASVAEGVKNQKAEQQVERYAQCLTAMSVDLQLSGHKHDFRFFADGVDGVPVPVLRCGGISSGLLGHSLTYTVLDFHEGEVSISAYNTRQSDALWTGTYTMSR